MPEDPIEALNKIYQLGDRMQRIVLLYYYCGLPCRVIADDLGVMPNTVLRIRKAALQELEDG